MIFFYDSATAELIAILLKNNILNTEFFVLNKIFCWLILFFIVAGWNYKFQIKKYHISVNVKANLLHDIN